MELHDDGWRQLPAPSGDDPDRLGAHAATERDGADPGTSKYDKAVKLGVPRLDDAGFRVLLRDGADAARAVATTGEDPAGT